MVSSKTLLLIAACTHSGVYAKTWNPSERSQVAAHGPNASDRIRYLEGGKRMHIMSNHDVLKLQGGGDSVVSSPVVNIVTAVYGGIFGLALLAGPSLFAQDGLFPLRNVEEFSPIETFYARMNGAVCVGMASRVIYEPRSVVTTQLLAVSSLVVLPLWITKVFLDNELSIKATHTKPMIFHGLLSAWLLVRSFTADSEEEIKGEPSVGVVNLVSMLYNGVYGLILLISPTFFLGHESRLLPLFTTEFTPLATYLARTLGAMLTTMAVMSFRYAPDSIATTKLFCIADALMIPLFIQNLLDTSDTFVKDGTWNKQITTQVVMSIWLWYKGFRQN